jgi:hypothetical protein
MPEPRVRIYIDDHEQPVSDAAPPVAVTVDTRGLRDGEHRLRIEAQDAAGDLGIRVVPFIVRNGPGITISGLDDGATVHGTISLDVNVFSATEPFEPRRAESRSPTPVWVWVLSLVIAAWSAWYFATEWTPPPDFARTPTYAAQSTRLF